jgi:Fe-S cluster biogenesis protein NfuA
MDSSLDDHDFRQRLARIESLLREVEQQPDLRLRVTTREVVQGVLEMHGVALERMLEQIAALGAAGQAVIDSLGRDGLVASLLLLHGLHPLDVDTRIREALEKARPALEAQGGDVELLAVRGGTVRLRVRGDGTGWLSSAGPLRRLVEEAICAAAPDVAAIEVEPALPGTGLPAASFVPADEVMLRDGQRPGAGR